MKSVAFHCAVLRGSAVRAGNAACLCVGRVEDASERLRDACVFLRNLRADVHAFAFAHVGVGNSVAYFYL